MNTRNKILLALLASTSCALAQAEVERRDLDGFTGVDASSGINVDIRIGDEFLVEVDSDENVDDIETEVRNGTLHVSVDSDSWDWGDWQDDYNVTIVMPALEKLEASGGTDIRVIGTVTGAEFDLSASGGADIDYYGDPEVLDEDESGSADITRH